MPTDINVQTEREATSTGEWQSENSAVVLVSRFVVAVRFQSNHCDDCGNSEQPI